MPELLENIYVEIQQLCAIGDSKAQQQKFSEALTHYRAAWALIPEPKNEWKAATWVLAAIADMNFLNGNYADARQNLSNAMHCPDAIGNPFLHLRLGQCQYELGSLDSAADELMRAYMGGGPEIFEGHNPKYIRYLQSKAQLRN